MSKKKDYTRFSKPEPEVMPEVTPEEVERTIGIEPTIGVVSDCVRLNVREDAAANALIVGSIDVGTELVIDMAESAGEFYKVITSAGIEGYCMKKFIRIMP